MIKRADIHPDWTPPADGERPKAGSRAQSARGTRAAIEALDQDLAKEAAARVVDKLRTPDPA